MPNLLVLEVAIPPIICDGLESAPTCSTSDDPRTKRRNKNDCDYYAIPSSIGSECSFRLSRVHNEMGSSRRAGSKSLVNLAFTVFLTSGLSYLRGLKPAKSSRTALGSRLLLLVPFDKTWCIFVVALGEIPTSFLTAPRTNIRTIATQIYLSCNPDPRTKQEPCVVPTKSGSVFECWMLHRSTHTFEVSQSNSEDRPKGKTKLHHGLWVRSSGVVTITKAPILKPCLSLRFLLLSLQMLESKPLWGSTSVRRGIYSVTRGMVASMD